MVEKKMTSNPNPKAYIYLDPRAPGKFLGMEMRRGVTTVIRYVVVLLEFTRYKV